MSKSLPEYTQEEINQIFGLMILNLMKNENDLTTGEKSLINSIKKYDIIRQIANGLYDIEKGED